MLINKSEYSESQSPTWLERDFKSKPKDEEKKEAWF